MVDFKIKNNSKKVIDDHLINKSFDYYLNLILSYDTKEEEFATFEIFLDFYEFCFLIEKNEFVVDKSLVNLIKDWGRETCISFTTSLFSEDSNFLINNYSLFKKYSSELDFNNFFLKYQLNNKINSFTLASNIIFFFDENIEKSMMKILKLYCINEPNYLTKDEVELFLSTIFSGITTFIIKKAPIIIDLTNSSELVKFIFNDDKNSSFQSKSEENKLENESEPIEEEILDYETKASVQEILNKLKKINTLWRILKEVNRIYYFSLNPNPQLEQKLNSDFNKYHKSFEDDN